MRAVLPLSVDGLCWRSNPALVWPLDDNDEAWHPFPCGRTRRHGRAIKMRESVSTETPEKSSPRERRRLANVERITQAAKEIVLAEGIDAISIKRVADDALYTPGALYRYFDSKDELISVVAVDLLGSLRERFSKVAAAAGEDSLLSAAAQVLSYCQYAREEPHGFALLSGLVSGPTALIESNEVARPALDAMFATLEPLGLAFAHATASGHLSPGDPAERSVVFFAAVQGLMMLRKLERIDTGMVRTDDFIGVAMRTLLLGWSAAPDEVDRVLARAAEMIQ